jgi:hypothetical protein
MNLLLLIGRRTCLGYFQYVTGESARKKGMFLIEHARVHEEQACTCVQPEVASGIRSFGTHLFKVQVEMI